MEGEHENFDVFCKNHAHFGVYLRLWLEFFSFLNGSEKVLIRRKNAPVTPRTNSGGKVTKFAFGLMGFGLMVFGLMGFDLMGFGLMGFGLMGCRLCIHHYEIDLVGRTSSQINDILNTFVVELVKYSFGSKLWRS